MGRCKSLGSLNSFLSHASQLSGANLISYSSCFLHFPMSSAITVGSDSIHWISVLGALTQIWRTEINDDCDISCLLIWQEIFLFHSIKADRIKMNFMKFVYLNEFYIRWLPLFCLISFFIVG